MAERRHGEGPSREAREEAARRAALERLDRLHDETLVNRQTGSGPARFATMLAKSLNRSKSPLGLVTGLAFLAFLGWLAWQVLLDMPG
ncbi:MAG: hypothetical protein ACFBSD_01185 [Paracoccaceae bacterium]